MDTYRIYDGTDENGIVGTVAKTVPNGFYTLTSLASNSGGYALQSGRQYHCQELNEPCERITDTWAIML